MTARAFLPVLMESRGYLLQIASLAAITPAPMMTAYCASKSGVEAYAHSLRAEVGYKGVRVGVGYLSWTDTDMVRGADQDDVMRELRKRLPWPSNKTYPLGPAVDRIVAGIERRSSHVYAQWWLRGMQGCAGICRGSSGPWGNGRCGGSGTGWWGCGRGWSERAAPPMSRSVLRGVTDRHAQGYRPCESGRGPTEGPTPTHYGSEPTWA